MANLTSSQIKDSYQSVLTTSETTSDPTTGTLQNGKGTAITTLTVSGTVNATTLGGTLSTASQPNVTSVGTLSGLTVSGATALQSDATVGGTGSTATRILQVQTNGTSAFPVLRLINSNATPNIANYIISQVTKDASGDEPAMLFNVQTTGGGNLTHRGYSWDNGTTRLMTLNASGNVGIGVTPSPWGSDTDAIQLGGSLFSTFAGSLRTLLMANAYYEGTDFKFVNTGLKALQYRQSAGTENHEWYASSASGNAGDNITFNQLMTLDASGNLGVGLIPTSRNNTRLQIVDGIGFPATQVASSDPNTLDDYEEGTFDLGISFGGSDTGVTYTNRQGKYTKIGRQVTVTGYIVLSSKGAETGAARITGLPFVIFNSTANYSSASLYFETITFANQFQGFGVINSTTIALLETTEAGVPDVITNSDFANNSTIMVSYTFFVS
jgi:hypothetical protein